MELQHMNLRCNVDPNGFPIFRILTKRERIEVFPVSIKGGLVKFRYAERESNIYYLGQRSFEIPVGSIPAETMESYIKPAISQVVLSELTR